ncbi:hypothetical protein HMPREF9378_1700 [Streptococcus sanguinis SK1 = NCTC 7863]|uniref:Uncharacterized protein n=2 Tax=Streptococcus sanguinis TaxID=1305 RepID=F2CHG1_STRSA|nr:hypothetical protein HMPREF9390_1711 [Streptococcus sanguinis SK405]EGC27655.1 hypothetical protein HMPREF9392_0176 [Streptococcus sanguinis SK678]EGF06471.1 hypothetical protein HMPREF9378_1700 [Streptococcus sanguinis SK1 = NCTC 7863]EGF17468.1 hypothetical protein HMPREF9391_2227 [Streptococcus sanguinis SK408]
MAGMLNSWPLLILFLLSFKKKSNIHFERKLKLLDVSNINK